MSRLFALPCVFASVFVAGCRGDVEPPAPLAVSSPEMAGAGDAVAAPATANVELKPKEAAAQLLRDASLHAALPPKWTDADYGELVATLLARGAEGDPVRVGRASTAIKNMGVRAVPGLAQGCVHTDVRTRRLAVATALQLGALLQTCDTKEPLLVALRTAVNDTDDAVRAAAEHALRIASGDSRELDRSRERHEAALRAAADGRPVR